MKEQVFAAIAVAQQNSLDAAAARQAERARIIQIAAEQRQAAAITAQLAAQSGTAVEAAQANQELRMVQVVSQVFIDNAPEEDDDQEIDYRALMHDGSGDERDSDADSD